MVKIAKSNKKLVINFIILVIFLFIVFVINKIPNGYIVASGDFHQEINFDKGITSFFYLWNDAGYGLSNIQPQNILFFIFQLILYKIGFSYSQIANSIMFLFLVCSFYSFYFSLKIFDKENNIPYIHKIFLSGIYSLNNFTLSIFTYSWGYTSFFLIYIFIPLLFVFFIKIFKEYNYKYFYGFLIIFLISTISYGNPGFFAALLLFQALLLIIFFLTKYVIFNKQNIKNYFILLILQILIFSYFLIPYFIVNFSFYSNITDSSVLGNYMDWISRTSYSIFNTLLMSVNDSSYPVFNPIFNNVVSIILSAGYFIFFTLLIISQEHKKGKKFAPILIFFIIFFILLLRLNDPFILLNKYIYKLPGFSFFRSPDKFFVFYPFFFLIIIMVLLTSSKLKKKVIIIFLIFLLLIPLPFYIKGINKYFIPNEKAQYYGFIKIPEEYKNLKNIINSSKNAGTIISLPSSIQNSVNWSNYNKWHFAGADILSDLYNNDFISANSFDSPTYSELSFWDYAVLKKVDEEKFINLLQKFNTKYIILHKDIPEHYINASKNIYETVDILVKESKLKKITENDYFSFFELSNDYIVPVIYSNENEVYFKKNSPVSYTIEIKNLKDKCTLYYKKTFSSHWNIYLFNNNNQEFNNIIYKYNEFNSIEYSEKQSKFDVNNFKTIFLKKIFNNSHSIVNHYGNSWVLDKNYIINNFPKESYKINNDGSIDLKIILSNDVQLFFYIGMALTLITLLIIILSFILKIKPFKNSQNIKKSIKL